MAPAQGTLPILVHCSDSLTVWPGTEQKALSTPPVFSTLPKSSAGVATPSIVATTCGMMPDWLQLNAHETPLGPMSEVSNWKPLLFGQPAGTAVVPVSATII